ncbi:PF07600 family protein [Leptospira interrogans serovar Canicola]|nr:PF07600 family protein [Leptospira interrogans serovar Canicola]
MTVKKIQSSLIEGSVGTDSLLVPGVYWNRLNLQEKKALRNKLPFFIEKIF